MTTIETPGGLEQLNAIARAPGVDSLFAGPNDVASSLGRAPRVDTDDAVVVEAPGLIAKSAVDVRTMAGLACESSGYARRVREIGFRLFVTVSNVRLMTAASRALLDEFGA